MQINCIEIVSLRPKSDGMTEDELRNLHMASATDISALHPSLVDSYLLRSEDGTYVDVLLWESRAGAQGALDGADEIAGFSAWAKAIDVLSFQMLDVVGERS